MHTRRDVLRLGGLSALGAHLATWHLMPAAAAGLARRPARSCILVWLGGGPSHIDTFDPKPAAPTEVRGPFRPIATSVPGVRICEHLPRLAALAHRYTIVRSMTSHLGEHEFGSHYLLTGYEPSAALVYPSVGSVFATGAGDDHVLPPHAAVGDAPNPFAGAGYLGGRYEPFVIRSEAAGKNFRVRDLEPHRGVTAARLARRRAFLGALDPSGADEGFEQAYRLTTSSEARAAFELSDEPDETRARYGSKAVGQSSLLARRLVERGVPFVTVTDGGWDTHEEIVLRLKEGFTGGLVGKLPALDRALSALLQDLHDRRLLEQTLVLVMGEFGRTPKMNVQGGRDHWPRVFSVLLAGGGVPGGQVVGASDEIGESPADRPVTPTDLARTVYTILGVDPERELRTADGRPVRVSGGGRVVEELLG